MYIVKIKNGEIETPIHDNREKLHSGKVVKGINAIDSFTFSMLPSNVGFGLINEFTTLVTVYNTNRKRYDFIGRVLYPETSMESNGQITKTVTCESVFGYLCDSYQTYVEEKNWTVRGLLQHLIDCHNSQVEDYKHFTLGEVTATDDNDNLYVGVQRDNTWDSIKTKLLDKIGGELRYRAENGTIYIDYVKQLGETKSTPIELSVNMKAITREKDPTAYVTRLIPLGCKLKKEVTKVDDAGNVTTEMVESEERLDITSVNNGLPYIDDEDAIAVYGIHVGVVEFDDVTVASTLFNKGMAWMIENNKVQVKYTITGLDLSLLGKSIDDFDVANYHPVKNKLLGVDDLARIIKKNIDICEEVKSTFEMGDNFKTLSDIQREQLAQMQAAAQNITKIEEATNNLRQEVSDAKDEVYELRQITEESKTEVLNDCNRIILEALQSYVETGEYDEFKSTVASQLVVLADQITMNFTTTTEKITNVDGVMQTQFAKLFKHIKFSGETAITIGSGDSALTLEIDNDNGISFKRNGVLMGIWTEDYFYTGNIYIRTNEEARFGNYGWRPRNDGSLQFLKVGG